MHATADAQRSFADEFLGPGRPLLVRDALAGFGWAPPWTLSALTERFGEERVPLYDTLFSLRGLSTFRRYVERYTGNAVSGVPPYLRWFVRQSPEPLPWADGAFAALEADWTMPDWLPDAD